MVIANDFKIQSNGDILFTGSPHPGYTLPDLHNYLCWFRGSVRRWIAVRDLYFFARRRYYGETPPTKWQRFFARLRGWKIMLSWVNHEEAGFRMGPGQVEAGEEYKFGGSEFELGRQVKVEVVEVAKGDRWHEDARVWCEGGLSYGMREFCQDFELVEAE